MKYLIAIFCIAVFVSCAVYCHLFFVFVRNAVAATGHLAPPPPLKLFNTKEMSCAESLF